MLVYYFHTLARAKASKTQFLCSVFRIGLGPATFCFTSRPVCSHAYIVWAVRVAFEMALFMCVTPIVQIVQAYLHLVRPIIRSSRPIRKSFVQPTLCSPVWTLFSQFQRAVARWCTNPVKYISIVGPILDLIEPQDISGSFWRTSMHKYTLIEECCHVRVGSFVQNMIRCVSWFSPQIFSGTHFQHWRTPMWAPQMLPWYIGFQKWRRSSELWGT